MRLLLLLLRVRRMSICGSASLPVWIRRYVVLPLPCHAERLHTQLTIASHHRSRRLPPSRCTLPPGYIPIVRPMLSSNPHLADLNRTVSIVGDPSNGGVIIDCGVTPGGGRAFHMIRHRHRQPVGVGVAAFGAIRRSDAMRQHRMSAGVQLGCTDCISARAWSGWPSLMAARMPGITAARRVRDGTGSGSSRSS